MAKTILVVNCVMSSVERRQLYTGESCCLSYVTDHPGVIVFITH
jgi:hypothetical protein